MVNALWRFAGVVCFVLESHEALPGQNLGDRRKEMSGIGTLEGVNLNDLPQRRAHSRRRERENSRYLQDSAMAILFAALERVMENR